MLRDNSTESYQAGAEKMEKLKLADIVIVCLFVFGLAFASIQRVNNQNIPENSLVEVSPQSDHLIEPAAKSLATNL